MRVGLRLAEQAHSRLASGELGPAVREELGRVLVEQLLLAALAGAYRARVLDYVRVHAASIPAGERGLLTTIVFTVRSRTCVSTLRNNRPDDKEQT